MMWKERKTVKVERQETDIPPITVGELKSVPRMRKVKSKKTKDISPKSKHLTICDISGTKMRISVNLMPVLAAAREPAEEEEEKEDNTGQITDKIIREFVEQIPDLHCESYGGIHLDSDFRQLSTQCVLPPAVHCKSVPAHSALPPIRPSEQTRNILSKVLMKSLRGDLAVTGEQRDNRPWKDNPLFSKSRSPEFRLPDISVSSLDALLQTVSQKLRRKRRDGEEDLRTRVQCMENIGMEKSIIRQQRANNVGRQTSLPTLFTPPKPTLFPTAAKTNIPT